MNPLDDLLNAERTEADDGIVLMTGLVAAVRWLGRGAMPGITVWDAIEQALRLRTEVPVDWSEADPLRAAIQAILAAPAEPLADLVGNAIRSWLISTCDAFNEGVNWPSA
jgi:hypothetical protein